MTHATSDRADPVLALHADAKHYPGGIAALARLIGRSPGVLHNKFSDSMPNYDVTDHEADAMGAVFGGLFVPLPAGEAGEADLLQAQLEMIHRFGELAHEYTESRRDGLITHDEFAALRLAGNRVVRAVYSFLKEVESQVPPEERGGHAASAEVVGISRAG